MKPWDIVLVYWVDSGGIGRWTDTKDVINDDDCPRCWTAGFFLGYNDNCIRIASSGSTSDSVDHVMFIPKVAIVKTTVLKRGSRWA